MGNEMGNNTTSGLKEEDFSAIESPKEYLKETSSADDYAKEDNHLEPAAESKNFQEKVPCLTPDDIEEVEDLCFNKQDSNKKEPEEEREVLVDDSPKDKVGSNEAGYKDSDNQLVSFSNDTEQELHMDQESLPNISSHKLEKQAFVKKEEEEMRISNVESMPLSLKPELQHSEYSMSTQHELGIIHVEPSVQNGSRSSWDSQDGTKLSSICTTEGNDHVSENEVLEDSEDGISTSISIVTEKKMNLLEEQKASQEERQFHEDAGGRTETGPINITTIPSYNMVGLGHKCDIGFPMENSLIKPDSIEISPKPHQEVPETQPKCMDQPLKSVMLNHDCNSDQSCEELMKETKPLESNAFQYESKSVGSAQESNDEKHDADPCINSESTKDFVYKKAIVVEDDDLLVGGTNKQNGVPDEYSKIIVENTATNLELGLIPAALNVEDSNHKENKSTENKIVEEEHQVYPLFSGENERGGKETMKQQSLPVGPAEALPPQSLSPLPQSEYDKQESALSSEPVQSSHQSLTDLKRNTHVSSSKDANLKAAEILLSMNGFTTNKVEQGATECIVIAQSTTAETKVSEKKSSEQCAKDEASAFVRCGSAANEYVERFSTDSDTSNLNVHGEMRKSPSFSLDLRIEARIEESDGTPLLYQDNSALQSLPSQDDVSPGNPITQNGYDQEVPMEEKIVKLEMSDSEKSKTPFLGFLREEEEVHKVAKPHKQDDHSENKREPKDFCKSPDKETTTSSAKGKQKRRTRSSLFGTCLCCATVIN